jgi:hypothetical protein
MMSITFIALAPPFQARPRSRVAETAAPLEGEPVVVKIRFRWPQTQAERVFRVLLVTPQR